MRFVIDSNIFVSSLDPKDLFHAECRPILEKILTGEIEVFSPSLVLVETTCVIRRRTNSEPIAVAVYEHLIRMPMVHWLDITVEVAERASLLGSQTGLRGGDALVAQVAEHYGIPVLTKDKEVKRKSPKGVVVLEPSEMSSFRPQDEGLGR